MFFTKYTHGIKMLFVVSPNHLCRNRNRGNSAANVNTGNTQATVSPSSTRGGSQSAYGNTSKFLLHFFLLLLFFAFLLLHVQTKLRHNLFFSFCLVFLLSHSRLRPTVNPSVKSKLLESAQQHTVDIYRHAPSRPDTLYPQPIPDKTAAKCRRDVCLLPDCFCGGKDIPGTWLVRFSFAI